LPLRNALAELTIAGLEDDAARAALAWLVEPAGDPPPAAAARLAAVHLIDRGGRTLLPVHAAHAGAAAAHAARAVRASAALRLHGGAGDPVGRAQHHAAALWNEGLFFEVHEVLEAVWRPARGDERRALQGVIQLAVAYHHLAHGNLRGARSLLVEGRQRLAAVPSGTLPVLDVPALLAETAPWETALAAGAAPALAPPRLAVRMR
jgi:hypothetical protein